MSEDLGYLCVGGPLDGLYFRAEGKWFRAPLRMAAPRTPAACLAVTVRINEVCYVREKFRTPGLSIDVWRPETQTVEETLTLLVEGYRKRGPTDSNSPRARVRVNYEW